jgi:amidase
MGIDLSLPAGELAQRLREGKLSSEALLEAQLARVEAVNPRINAVVTLDAGNARERARALDDDSGLLADTALRGLPVTIKDSFETAGLLSTCGAPKWKRHRPQRDADAVERLRQAGAVPFGKTNVPIYAGDIQSYNLLFGTTNNPWDASRTCGGSSGGAAAAVACGMSPFELGSDIGGSIRIPAHFCGVYGHKPTYGRVPMRGHLPPAPGALTAPDLAVAGPIARSAQDLELLLGVLADVPQPPRPARRLSEYRVAAWMDDPDFPVDVEVAAVLEAALDALGTAGARIDRQARPLPSLAANFDHYLRMLWPITTADLSQKAFARLQEAGRAAEEESWWRRLADYSAASHREWQHLHERRAGVRELWRRFFDDYDLLLCPVAPACAFAHDQSEDLMARTIRINGEPRWYWEQLGWIALATLAWLPATSAPVGRSASGLPVGLQIVGPHGGDSECIAFAHLLADAAGGYSPPPA